MQVYCSIPKLSLLLSYLIRTFESTRKTQTSIKNHWTNDLSKLVILYSSNENIKFSPKYIGKHLKVLQNDPQTIEAIDKSGGVAIIDTILDINALSKHNKYFCIEYTITDKGNRNDIIYINIGFLVPNIFTMLPHKNTIYSDCLNTDPNKGFGCVFYKLRIKTYVSSDLLNKIGTLIDSKNSNCYFKVKDRFGLRINLESKTIDCFYNGKMIGKIYKKIPDYLIPCMDCDGKIGSKFSVKVVENFEEN